MDRPPALDPPRPQGVRARVRAELTAEIKALARRQLAEVGAADLSLRAVARELGMASSALYRYFPSRDDLLTALIIDAYDAIGAEAEQADARVTRADHLARHHAVGRAVRTWALGHPHEYALIYGSPVPGYVAPGETVPAATRTAAVLTRLLHDAHAAGHIDEGDRDVPAALGAELDALAARLDADVPAAVLARGLVSWTGLFGVISFELFGHFHNVVDERDALFEIALDGLAAMVGLR